MLCNVLWRTLQDRRRSLLAWGLGITALTSLMMVFYPSIRDAGHIIEEYIEAMPEELMGLFGGQSVDYSSIEGFLNTELFFFMAPLLFLIFAIGFGSSAIAGEEEQGTLDLLLSTPLPRWRAVLEKFGALIISVFVLGFVFWTILVLGILAVDADINLGRLTGTVFSVTVLGITYGTLALAVGCARGKRAQGLAVASVFGIYGYLLNALAPMIDWLEPFRILSPFYYFISADPLINGLNLFHTVVLLGLTIVFLTIAVTVFERRDLAV
mgnify:FL=1